LSPRASIAVVVLGALAAAATGCFIEEQPFTPVACGPNRSCPAFYTCVDTPSNGPICEANYAPGKPDAAPPPAGPYRDYCHDAWPLFDAYCVECHGPDQQLGVIRFRLDFYEADAGFLGARLMAPVVRNEVFVFRTMPPQTAMTFPTNPERLIIAQWVDAGAPFCGPSDGGDGGG